MEVRIFARPNHRHWIESEGFLWAESPVAAAQGADALSVYLGLGAKGPEGFVNAGVIGAEVLSSMAPGAVLVNYDRGKLVDVPALAAALASGQIGHAAVDAALFRDAESGSFSGPMRPYLDLVEGFGDRLSLLLHAAADTDHPTRVAGAKQAVDHILAAIREGAVRNLKGDLPAGCRDAGPRTPPGLGGLSAAALAGLAETGALVELSDLASELARCAASVPAEGQKLLLAANQLVTLLRASGIEGRYLG